MICPSRRTLPLRWCSSCLAAAQEEPSAAANTCADVLLHVRKDILRGHAIRANMRAERGGFLWDGYPVWSLQENAWRRCSSLAEAEELLEWNASHVSAGYGMEVRFDAHVAIAFITACRCLQPLMDSACRAFLLPQPSVHLTAEGYAPITACRLSSASKCARRCWR